MDRVRKLRWLPAVLAAAALFATLALAACGEEDKVEGAEGEFITVGEMDYQVQLTRLLNPEQRPDECLLAGSGRAARG